ncbi:endonuclease III [Mucilaginibacter rubeus]|uniref:Endonuclease III n=1 Tax=Mucilaginibacter rubeus TaxID=2027860 RepID=A0AAE6JHR8_9SPHI|nr:MULTISPECIES: endonuclease III [Mucilaginibacter]QEM05846.1 endonuclease III [Mucilaginibacter rubeus]QEM18428.1 endonuclease III [Mucilaginibacter gossypii]QTE45034.1 endonuclease III [Mucilaginibacter rubeus]QTE51631.1 endonuclease III [Mucilaginibacter rubeus]QTE56717.1 endonuclease III [Mucilaginibacter rubeus]
MLKDERYRHFVDYFSKNQPNPVTELHYNNPFQLLVAVILSAQCTDKRINQVTPALFERFPTPQDLAAATSDEVFAYIRSVSYPNNKAKHLVGMGKMLMEVFNGEIPSGIENLQKLPGVGRKTANVIASVIFEEPAMAVDTHVFRVANRIGLTNNARTPLAVEKQLVQNIPKEYIGVAHHWLILHGRYICLARSPKCDICPLTWFCRYYERNNTEAALQRLEAAKLKKAKEAKKKKALNIIDKELKKRSVIN